MCRKLILFYLSIATGVFSLCPAVQGEEKTPDKSVKIITLSISPAAEPAPALAYSLLPRYIDQKNGNAALKYYTAAGLYPSGNSQDINEKIVKWLALPVEQLDRKKVEETLSNCSSCFHQIELAAQCNYCNWELPIEDGYAMAIPDLSTFRNIIRALQLQVRLKIADGQTNQALKMMSEGMYMGRCIAEGPTIVQSLVGNAIEALMLKEVEEIIQKPHSPNLYWALTSLPNPLIDMRHAMKYEHESFFVEFPQLRTIENDVLTPEQALKIISDFWNKAGSLTGEGYNVKLKELLPAVWVMANYSDAKKYLADKSYSKERIEKMPAAQAVLIYQKQQYMKISDNMYKWFSIPYYQSRAYLEEAEKQLSNFDSEGLRGNVFTILSPPLSRIALLQARGERNVAMLRTIEAIRMFAAEHSGQLPESLEKITSVPIPTDPVTGKHFIYNQTDKQNARLEAPLEPGPEENQQRPVYILSIKQ